MSTLTRRKDPVTYIPLPLAVQKYHLDADRVQAAIENGEIEIAHVEGSADPLLLDESLREWLAARRVDRAKFTSLEGQKISVNDAAEKYGFHYSTIMHWIEMGKIKSFGLAPGYKRRLLVNEADIAYARALADLKQPIAGQGVFG
ncbi:MAG: hypothetical protein JXA89_11810 [Anaerolineae bacterium]|nr:hypothetical protein [Anaerolineae bacterium]